MLLFEKFLKSYIKDYDYMKLSAVVTNSNFSKRKNAYHYYSLVENEKIEFLINQVDGWVATQGSPINFFERIIEAIIIQEHISEDVLKKCSFVVITRDGIAEEDYFNKDKNQKPKARFERTQMHIEDDKKKRNYFFAPPEKERYIFLEMDCLYDGIDDCNRNYNIVKLFLNSLTKKIENRDESLKNIYAALNLSEQTFYSWKKKNPEMFKALVDGYFFGNIKEIVRCLSEIPSLQRETWNNYEPMKYLNGDEF